ncbi:MAG: VCBS repeat-containing protein [Acidobacteria bacterium]|nr:VCBS repeat-containing protein [Acidobacteriota bacterium]
MLRRSALAIASVLVLAGSAELIRLAALPAPGQTPWPPASQVLGLRPQTKHLPRTPDRLRGKTGSTEKQVPLVPAGSLDVSSLFLTAPTYLTGGVFPLAMVATDVNKDGIPDVVVAQGLSQGTIGVSLGSGDGTFQPAQAYGGVGVTPYGLAVADISGDGNPDLVVATNCAGGGVCSGKGSVALLFGNGDGTFQAARALDTGAFYATAVAVADVNGDTHPDLLVTNRCTTGSNCSGLASVFLGNGDGTFASAQNYSTGGLSPFSIVTVDVNGDGKADMVMGNLTKTVNDVSGTIGVLLGNGDGTFQGPQTYPSGGIYANAIAVADVNGDHVLDVVAANDCFGNCSADSDSAIGVLLGNGDGTFRSAQLYDSGGLSASSVAIADVNGDATPDVLVANRRAENGSVGVLLGNGDGTFLPIHTYDSMGNSATAIAAADTNADGKPDVIVANGQLNSSDSRGSVAVMLGHGDGSFQAAPIYSPGANLNTSATMADVNGDGKPDVIVASACTPPSCTGSVDVLLGNGDGTLQPPLTYDSGGSSPDPSNVEAVKVADVNGDGKLDLIVANQYPPTACCDPSKNGLVGILLGNGDGTFQSVVTYDSGGYFASSVAIADLNSDGMPDLLVANQCVSGADCGSGTVSILLGDGTGAFGAAQTFASGGFSPNSIAATDVNGDGVPDLLVLDNCLTASCSDHGQVAVLLGNGGGAYQAAQIYDSGSFFAHSLAVADLNGDAKPDLIVSNESFVSVLLGNGDGTFQSAINSLAEAGFTGHLAVADFDGDGILDVASSDGSLFLGNGDGRFTDTAGLIPPGGLAVGDLDENGKPDIAVGGVTILLNISPRAATTTTLFSSLNPSELGQTVDFTANVTSAGSGTPSGHVTFKDGAAVLGTQLLSNGVAIISVSSLSEGTHTITAVYGSDADFRASRSLPLSQLVNGNGLVVIDVAETIHVTDSPELLKSVMMIVNEKILVTDSPGLLLAAMINVNESIHVSDAPAVVTSHVTPIITWPAPAPITYGTALSVTQLNATANTAGTFIYTPPAGTVLAAGNQTLSAAFTPTDTANYTSANASVGLLVNQASTAVQLTSSANPQFVNQPITFTATITSPAAGSATGSVVFFAGTTNLGTVSVAGNTASVTTSFSAAGNRSITAQYSGDNNYAGSTSAPLIQSVVSQQVPTTLTVTSSLNPSFVSQAVTFTATFGTGRPPDGGTITFKRGAANLGTAAIVGGAASFTTSNLPLGRSRIIAIYQGDAFFGRSSAAMIQRVNRYTTTTTLASDLNPATYGQTVSLTATVTALDTASATGTVTFRNGGSLLGTATLRNDGTATLPVSGLAAGVYSLTATYNGNGRNAKSNSSALNETVNLASSTTTLTSSINPSRAGQSVKFSASVATNTGAVAKGSVTFSAGGVNLGTVTLAGGKASISTRSLPPGANVITATYAGNPNVTGSSATLTQQVN